MATLTAEPKFDVKQAAEIAFNYLRSLMPIPADDISLEEVELDGKEWHVTLGFTSKHQRNIAAIMGDSRVYKVFKIDSTTGRVLSMRIRKP
ncbi:MAG: hypothetical protein ACKVYV_16430 [Limisphaerales bacterium]